MLPSSCAFAKPFCAVSSSAYTLEKSAAYSLTKFVLKASSDTPTISSYLPFISSNLSYNSLYLSFKSFTYSMYFVIADSLSSPILFVNDSTSESCPKDFAISLRFS